MKLSGIHKSAAIFAIFCLHALAAVFFIYDLSKSKHLPENKEISESVPLRVAARPGFLAAKDAGEPSVASAKKSEDSSAMSVHDFPRIAESGRNSDMANAKTHIPAEMPASQVDSLRKKTREAKPKQPASADVSKKQPKVVATTEFSENGKASGRASSSRPSQPTAKAHKAGKGGQNASLPCASGGICDASSLAVILRPDFVYPASARRRGIQGSVVLLLSVGADGKVSSSKVSGSSGFGVLDASAAEYASKMIFDNPYQTGIIVRLPVTYKLGQ